MAQIKVGKQIFEGEYTDVPELGTNPDEFINNFRSIQQPHFEAGMGKAASIGIAGGMINDAASAAVDVQKMATERYLSDRIEPLKEEEINRQAGRLTSLLGGGADTELPAAVKEHEGKITALNQLRDSKNVPETYYHAAVYQAQKDTRSMVPRGFRDFVDATTDRLTNLGHANEVMRALKQAADSIVTKQQAERNKAESFGIQAMQHDPSLVPLVKAVREGVPGAMDELYKRGAEVMAKEHQSEQLNRELQTGNLQAAEAKRNADAQADIQVPRLVNDSFSSWLTARGYNSVTDMQRDMDANQEKAQAIAESYTNVFIPSAEQKVRDYLTRDQVDDKGNKYNLSKYVDVDKKVQEATAYNRRMAAGWANSDAGILYKTRNAERNAQEAYDARMKKDPYMAAHERLIKHLTGLVGNQGLGKAKIDQEVESIYDRLNPDIPNASPGTSGYLHMNNNKVAMGELGEDGRPIRTLDELRFNKSASRAENPVDNDAIIAAPINAIKDSTLPITVRQNNAARIFSRENYGLMGMLPRSKFEEFTSPDMMKSMKELGTGYERMYHDFVKNEASKYLLRPAFSKVQDIPPGVELHYNSPEEKSKAPFFSYAASPGYEYDLQGMPTVMPNNLQDINSAIRALHPIAREQGTDVTSYLHELTKIFGPSADLFRQAIEATIPPPPPKPETPGKPK